MQCSTDAVTSIRREALRLTHSLRDILISHNKDTEQTAKRVKIEESATSTGPGLAVPPTSSNEASVVLESSTAIVGSGTKAVGEHLRETDACSVGLVQCKINQLNNNSTSDDAGHQLLVSCRTNAEVERTLDDRIEDSRQNDDNGTLTNAAASSEVDAILEAVLDYPDRLTLSALCRTRDVVSLLPSDRPQTPAVSVEKFLHFSENLATAESDAERANREVLELLEDIELQVRRRKIEKVELEYSEPTHLTMDCY
ncbi:uncharacterized protein LOC108664328 [Hyalella azteca]|uniref:Uncharacterized protein LOC108664328 n=1 Tax=Hyalella azteca TaxID=294128 RepID=A0A8B7MYQ0_HYAAZ|nr:uncharacterized protein LOC108664328 [Hyalella azteca]